MRSQFLERAQRAIEDQDLQRALDQNADRRGVGRHTALNTISGIEQIKAEAQKIRSDVIERLPELLEVFSQNMQANGWQVHRTATASEACEQITHIAAKHGTQLVVKSKSMVTEEIHLNQALAEADVEVVETDLGEFIVQLRNEPPGHIITPAIHLMREDVAQTFVEHLGIDFTTDVSALNQAARQTLRPAFFDAGIGISGVNFGVVEPGAICLVTNEGNGRMVTSLPEVHIAVIGIERLVPTLQDLEIMLQLLPRSATGQILTSYISLIRSNRAANNLDGPTDRHIILLDNGRSALRQSSLHSALLCIRCGACLNACPIYREVGGHTYESVYPGPIGSVISPGLFGLERFGHLSKASTLCGACQDACPVDIDLPRLLLRTRDGYVRQTQQPAGFSMSMKLFRWISSSSILFTTAIRLAALFTRIFPGTDGWLKHIPGPFQNWTRHRDFPRFAVHPFRTRYSTPPMPDQIIADHKQDSITSSIDKPIERQDPILDRFSDALQQVDGEFVRCPRNDIGSAIIQFFESPPLGSILMDPAVSSHYPELTQSLENTGIEIIIPQVDRTDDRIEQIAKLDSATIGITVGIAAIAESGTVIVGQDDQGAAITSLLPDMHVALIPEARFYETLTEWMGAQGKLELSNHQSITLITGPSRTADIEMTLTIGVHGPARLIVIMITD
jgi:L-lactate dehydrogenase complex protein LldF